jgi:acetoin utilization deacetylase AcuC-like enzyme
MSPARLACFSSPRYFAPLPAGHVFPMRKFPDSAAVLGADPRFEVIDPGLIADADLLRVHDPAYVESIRSGRFNEPTALRLGLPWSEPLYWRSRAATAGTLAAARRALGGDGVACNLAGGTHHAFPDRGEGFCVFNDIAVAIRALQADDPYYHLMVIDLDAHQGNGTHAIFAGDGRVFTYSVHVGANYPSRKVPGSLDVELPRWVGGAEYFARLEATLPAAVEQFEPDLVFYIAGVDVHEDDRFGQMKLTTADVARRDRRAMELCRGWGVPTVVTYGGGYNKAPDGTTNLHVQTIRIAADFRARDGG